jgi:hypothetical protein
LCQTGTGCLNSPFLSNLSRVVYFDLLFHSLAWICLSTSSFLAQPFTSSTPLRIPDTSISTSSFCVHAKRTHLELISSFGLVVHSDNLNGNKESDSSRSGVSLWRPFRPRPRHLARDGRGRAMSELVHLLLRMR